MKSYRKFVPAHVDTVELYTYDELDESAKQTVQDKMNDLYYNEVIGWHDEIVQTVNAIADIFGLDVRPNGYGDGICFSDFQSNFDMDCMDFRRTIAMVNNRVLDKYKCTVKEGLDGKCPFTGVFSDCTFFDTFAAFVDDGRKNTRLTMYDFFRSLGNAYCELLQEDYEYYQSEQGITDYCDGNGIMFTVDGEEVSPEDMTNRYGYKEEKKVVF